MMPPVDERAQTQQGASDKQDFRGGNGGGDHDGGGDFGDRLGAGTPADSDYRGAYGGREWAVNSPNADDSGDRTLTLDQKGRLYGSFISESGAVSALTGTVGNDGRFTLTVTRGSVSYPVEGKLSHGVPIPNAATGVVEYKEGIAGDFRETINGTVYTGTFMGAGGVTTK